MKKKNKGVLFVGILLIIFQLMSFYGSIVLNNSELPQDIFGWIGFCLFGIIGIGLIFNYLK